MQIGIPACFSLEPKALECMSMTYQSLCIFRNKDVFNPKLCIDHFFSTEHQNTIINLHFHWDRLSSSALWTEVLHLRQSEDASACCPAGQQRTQRAKKMSLDMSPSFKGLFYCSVCFVFSD